MPLPDPNEYRVGCDCISGFVSNYQGFCIDEADCNYWEAFGALIDEGAIRISAGNWAPIEQENRDETLQNAKNSQTSEESPQFYRESIENSQYESDILLGKSL